MEKKQVTFRIDPAIIKKIKFLAVEQDCSLTDLFLEAIQDILNKYEKKSKKS
jgi:predicted HicB family RNase H-like nuclease